MRFITITRCITVEAWKHIDGEDVPTFCEFVPGQKVRVRGRSGNCFHLATGWAEIPRDAWRDLKSCR